MGFHEVQVGEIEVPEEEKGMDINFLGEQEADPGGHPFVEANLLILKVFVAEGLEPA